MSALDILLICLAWAAGLLAIGLACIVTAALVRVAINLVKYGHGAGPRLMPNETITAMLAAAELAARNQRRGWQHMTVAGLARELRSIASRRGIG